MGLAPLHQAGLAFVLLGGLTACAQAKAPVQGAPLSAYQGVETRLLDSNLVEFRVKMKGARSNAEVISYARCAAAQYTLIRGYGFVRHLRTTINKHNGVWTGDAVYTISRARPQGLKTIDARLTVADCAQNGIPMV